MDQSATNNGRPWRGSELSVRKSITRAERKILLPYLLVCALLIVSVALFIYDARTIIAVEETEEDFSKILLMMGSYLNGLQRTQIDQHEFLLSCDTTHLGRYAQEKLRCATRIDSLRRLVAEDFPDSSPKIDVIGDIQSRYLSELDKTIAAFSQSGCAISRATTDGENKFSPYYLQQIQLLLAQTEVDIAEVRQGINAKVATSVYRASVITGIVAVLLIAILGFGYRITSRALVDNRRLAEQLAHEATHDALTHLPNRRYFHDWLQKSMAMAQRMNFSLALYFIDLDGFKLVNDQYGHDVGDEVLRVATKRFQGLMRESDLLVRLGGDEFAILVSQAPGAEELAQLAERMISALSPPIKVGSAEPTIGASIGIAVFPRDASDSDALIRASDEAMYRAKERGKGQYCFA